MPPNRRVSRRWEAATWPAWAANLDAALEMRLKADPIARATARDEVPLSTALALMVRERLTGKPVPERAAAGVDLVRDWIEEKAGADLDALPLTLDDQASFAGLAQQLLQNLGLAEPQADDEDGSDDDADEDGERRKAARTKATARTKPAATRARPTRAANSRTAKARTARPRTVRRRWTRAATAIPAIWGKRA